MDQKGSVLKSSKITRYRFLRTQSGANERFNGKFRDECLGMQWFKNLIE